MESKKKQKYENPEDDPWRLIDPETTGTPWAEQTCCGKIKTILLVLMKICLILGFLYIFVCSLDFLSSAFRLLGGKQAGETFNNNDILNNPIADLTIGVLATVLLQSSSTTTSIVVAMVGSEILPIKPAIFMVMGANIGTSVTNTIVAMGQSMDRNEFRKAFAGATVHDMFNWLCVIVLLPIEWISGSFGDWNGCGLLCQLTGEIVKDMKEPGEDPPDFLKVITEPLTKRVISVDRSVITDIAKGIIDADWDNVTLVKTVGCDDKLENNPFACFDRNVLNTAPSNVTVCYRNETIMEGPYPCYENSTNAFSSDHIIVHEPTICNMTNMMNMSVPSICYETVQYVPALCPDYQKKRCDHWFMDAHDDGWSDAAIGVCVLIIALGLLIICLVAIVKLLHSLLKGKIAWIIKNFLNSNMPGAVGRVLTGYLAIIIGAGLTMLVQSSSIFTSALTPLVGCGVLHIERMYPLTLGANIGTTVTAILAALASEPEQLKFTMQIALCHLFFNIIGILIWYPIPFMRKLPIKLSKMLGNTTAKYRWFAIVYLVAMFFLFPALVFALSIAGWEILLGVGVPLVIFVILIIVINVLQTKRGDQMGCLATWNFLPKFLHSLEPYDRVFSRCCCVPDEEMEELELEDKEITITSNGDAEHGTNGFANGATNEGYE